MRKLNKLIIILLFTLFASGCTITTSSHPDKPELGVTANLGESVAMENNVTFLLFIPVQATEWGINYSGKSGNRVKFTRWVSGESAPTEQLTDKTEYTVNLKESRVLNIAGYQMLVVAASQSEAVVGFLKIRDEFRKDVPKLGISTKTPENMEIVKVHPDSPSKKAGTEKGDHFISFDGNKIQNIYEIRRWLSVYEIGQKVPVVIERNGKKKELIVKLASDKSIDWDMKKRKSKDEHVWYKNEF